ncbi:VraH family peptide resistance protein [Staphylococcus sp. GDX7P312P]|uniref:VraH family peptide resistance protein n=1 Tax=Staphylococcus sp. GDX7P312P TaxID=2608388 RepID=UPI00122E43CE|nr:VraH family protein [Staphylococcus sp. GDX7P312P]KAA2271361.1 VraH family protein [Staphylococcus sp. GDX7P312P]
MNIKELRRKSYAELLSLKVNGFNGLLLILIVFILRGIATPFIGVVVGVRGGGYILKR